MDAGLQDQLHLMSEAGKWTSTNVGLRPWVQNPDKQENEVWRPVVAGSGALTGIPACIAAVHEGLAAGKEKCTRRRQFF